jgi:hypothetical protein
MEEECVADVLEMVSRKLDSVVVDSGLLAVSSSMECTWLLISRYREL